MQVLNGLLEREDWENAIKIPLGVIPAGEFSACEGAIKLVRSQKCVLGFSMCF